MNPNPTRPTAAFVGASWTALFVGSIAYITGLWNAAMPKTEKGYYLTILLFGLFSAVSLQKAVRDRMESIPVTNIYYGISWLALILSITLLTVGLWDAEMTASEKGFYSMAYILSVFSAVAVQKNVRDIASAEGKQPPLPGK